MKPREIKFRAWDKKAGKMLFGEPKNVFFWLDEGQPVEIMQYTGLKDKHGKEIFEGDVLRCGSFMGEVVYVSQPTFDQGDEVGAGFHLKAQINGYSHLIPFDQYLIENGYVVDNIFKNPELLNQ